MHGDAHYPPKKDIRLEQYASLYNTALTPDAPEIQKKEEQQVTDPTKPKKINR
jgi:hypothetical protein